MDKIKKGVRLDHISKIYQDPKTGKDFYAVKDTSLTIEPGSFVTLLGPSGCGKTTTLRMIAGFESPDEGEIYLGDEPINALTPNKRDTAMVFQSYALLPHYNVFDNVAYGLKLRKVPKDEIRERVMHILDLVELTGMEGRMTNQLSGITAIYVTHDQSEAMALSDQIIIMNKGVVAQIGTPQEIYYHPVSEFVADFIGEANFLRGKMTGTENGLAVLDVEGERLAVAPREGMRVGEEYTVVLRPESAALSDEGGLPCTVELSCFMGSYQNYHVRVGNTLVKLAENDPRNKRIYRVGEQCHLTFAPDTVHVL